MNLLAKLFTNSIIEQIEVSHQSFLADTLIYERLSLKMSVGDMADLVSLPPDTYTKYEYGEKSLTIEDYEKVLDKIHNYKGEIKYGKQ